MKSSTNQAATTVANKSKKSAPKDKSDEELSTSPWPRDAAELERRMKSRMKATLGNLYAELIRDEHEWLIKNHPSEAELKEYKRRWTEAHLSVPLRTRSISNDGRFAANSWLRVHLKDTRKAPEEAADEGFDEQSTDGITQENRASQGLSGGVS